MKYFATRVAMLALIALLSSCSLADHGFLASAGPVAEAERDHFFSIIGWTLIVIVPLFVALPIVLWKYRIGKKSSVYRPQWTFSWTLEGLVWGIPLVIVAILGVNLWTVSHKLDPYDAIPSDAPPLAVQVVSLDWKWLFIYPKQGVAAVNELVLPVGRPVRFKLTSATVMQSFFIPRLGSQIYTMPGMTTQLHLLGARPGTYRGQNTQYNGAGFAEQKFTTHVVAAKSFQRWVANLRRSKPALDRAAYKKIAQRSVLPKPERFGAVRDDLFQSILARTQAKPAAALQVAAPKAERAQRAEAKRLKKQARQYERKHGA